MIDIPFLLDKCDECGSKWRADDRDASGRCLVCGSSKVTPARPAVLVGAAAVVLGFAAIAFALTRPHGQGPGGSMAQVASTPSYVAPISTALPGSTPAPSAVTPSAASSPARDNGDTVAATGGKAKGDVAGVSAVEDATAEQFPTMDCAVSRSEAAHKVCASPALTRMDQDLSLIYSVAAQAGTSKQSLAAEQLRWQQSVLEACADEACMINAYKQRTSQLAAELGGQNQ